MPADNIMSYTESVRCGVSGVVMTQPSRWGVTYRAPLPPLPPPSVPLADAATELLTVRAGSRSGSTPPPPKMSQELLLFLFFFSHCPYNS